MLHPTLDAVNALLPGHIRPPLCPRPRRYLRARRQNGHASKSLYEAWRFDLRFGWGTPRPVRGDDLRKWPSGRGIARHAAARRHWRLRRVDAAGNGAVPGTRNGCLRRTPPAVLAPLLFV